MNSIRLFRCIVLTSILFSAIASIRCFSTPPGWWVERGVVNPTVSPSDYAAVNQGQVKNMATQAYYEMQDKLSGTGGAGATLDALINSWKTSGTSTADFNAATLGQLKTVAQPFLDRLIQIGYTQGPVATGTYPWVSGTANDYALANIGQVKNLFDFDLTNFVDSDHNGLGDSWETTYFGKIGNDPNAMAPNGLGLTLLYCYQNGVDPIHPFASSYTVTLSTSGTYVSTATSSAAVQLTANLSGTSTATVQSVSFYLGNGLLGSVAPSGTTATWTMSNLNPGIYSVKAVSLDSNGAVASASALFGVGQPGYQPTITNENWWYMRGSSNNYSYYSYVVPVDFERGIMPGMTGGLEPGSYGILSGYQLVQPASGTIPWRKTPWFLQIASGTSYHIATDSFGNPFYPTSMAFANPVVAFGDRAGGTPLYTDQSYSFGVVSGGQFNAQLVSNSSFETPSISGSSQYRPAGSGWTFTSNSGIQANGSGWSATNAPDGTQTAFLQGTGTMSQTINFSVAGSYFISFQAARRTGQLQPVLITVDGTTVGTYTPASDNFANITTTSFTVTSGTHMVQFEGTDNTGDKSSFIDLVSILPVNATINLSFENPVLASGSYSYNPANAGWTFSGYSGVQSNGSTWGAAAAPDGVQTAFLRGNGHLGVISQGFAANYSGDYLVSFQAAQRSGQVQPISVSVDGTQVGLITPSGTNFTAYQTGTFNILSGTHSLQFSATDNTGDQSSFIDSVSILPVDFKVDVYAQSSFASGTAANVTPVNSQAYHLPRQGEPGWDLFARNGYQMPITVTGTDGVTSGTFNVNVKYATSGFGEIGNLANYPLLFTVNATSSAFYLRISVKGAVRDTQSSIGNKWNWMAVDSNSFPAYSTGLTLDFTDRQSWQSAYLNRPSFTGAPIPEAYSGMSLDELLNVAPIVTGTDSLPALSGTAATAPYLQTGTSISSGTSPELVASPVLDNFVSSMANDPMALANYVQNEIELTDAIALPNATGTLTSSDSSINFGGVNRGALGVLLEGQGSPVEQCGLLVYLLRKAGVPCGYVFGPVNGMQMLDSQLSKMLRMQLGAAQDYGVAQNPGGSSLISVNYPWVAAYINGQWVHLFPWIKDTVVQEGYNLYDYMPAGYKTGAEWVRQYLYNDPAIRTPGTENYDNPGVLFPQFVQNNLPPNLSLGDIGVTTYNRRHYYTDWSQFPHPWQRTAISGTANLYKDLMTYSATAFPMNTDGLFDKISIQVTNNGSKVVSSGTLYSAVLNDRRFLLYHTPTGAFPNNSGTSAWSTYNMNLSLEAASPLFGGTNTVSGTATAVFSGSGSGSGWMLNKQFASVPLASTDDGLTMTIHYVRHSTQVASNQIIPFLDLVDVSPGDDTRPLRKGDTAAICLSFGRVTHWMLETQEEQYWNMQQRLLANPSQTPDIELAQGLPAYLMGMSYYYRLGAFDDQYQQLTKMQIISNVGHGLAKFSPIRVSGSPALTYGSLNLQYPNVDMFYNDIVMAGNSTVHPDSGNSASIPFSDYYPVLIAAGSAQEHLTIQQYFKSQSEDAVSTVKLLDVARGLTLSGTNFTYPNGAAALSLSGTSYNYSDIIYGPLTVAVTRSGITVTGSAGVLSVTGTAGMIELNDFNYRALGELQLTGTTVASGTTRVTQPLKTWAGSIWTSCVNALSASDGNFHRAFITPGPLLGAKTVTTSGTQQSYYGMAALIFGPYGASALIAPNSNGAYGGISYVPFTATTVSVGNVIIGDAFPSGSITGPSITNYASSPIVPANTTVYVTPNISLSTASDTFGSLMGTSSISYTFDPSYESALINQSNLLGTSLGGSTATVQWVGAAQTNLNYGTLQPDFYNYSQAVADPVNTVTGEFYVDNVDLHLNGPIPLEIRRNYGSQNQFAGAFGFGWKISMVPYLVLSSSNTLIYAAEMNGSVVMYRQTGTNSGHWIATGSDNPEFINPASDHPGSLANVLDNYIDMSTSGTNTLYTLTGADGSKRIFQTGSFPTSGTNGVTRQRPYLQKWQDNRGNYFTFTFGNDSTQVNYGQLTRIQSSNGNYANFMYDTYGHIVMAYTGDGSWCYYQYDDYGDLTQVTLPDGSTVQYTYSHQPTPNGQGYYSEHLITQEIKPDGRLLVNTYEPIASGSSGSPSLTRRVVKQQATSGTSTTLVTNATFAYNNSYLVLADGNFESPVVSSGSFRYTPTGSPWVFSGLAGIVSNGSVWHNAASPDGSQAAVLQGNVGLTLGTISQQIYFPTSGTYAVQFEAARRAGYGIQPIKFSYEGTQVGSTITPSGTSFAMYQTGSFVATSGTHTIQFAATAGSSDCDSFIDSVAIVNSATVSGTTILKDVNNHNWEYDYTNSQITRTVDPLSQVVSQQWYPPTATVGSGTYPCSLKSRTDKRGLLASYQYDSNGNVTQIVVSGTLTGTTSGTETATTTMSYNPLNLLLATTDANGNSTSFAYGDNAHPYEATSITKSTPAGNVSTTVLQYTDVTSGSGGSLASSYGVLQQQISASETPDQSIVQYTYNGNGFPTSKTEYTGTQDPNVVTTYTYDLRGEVTSVADSAGRKTVYNYDARGNRTAQLRYDESGNLVSWQFNYYNLNGDLAWSQGPRYSPDDYVMREYDFAGHLSQEIKWRSQAGGAGVVQMTDDNGNPVYAQTFYTHDNFGNLTQVMDPNHNITAMGYDAIGQMTSRQTPYGSGTASESFTYEPGGKLASHITVLGGTDSRAYTSTGLLLSDTEPDGTNTSYQYDRTGRVIRETLANGNYWVTAYDDYNRTISGTFYDNTGTFITKKSETYDRRGNVIAKTDVDGNTFYTTYDGLNRVKSVTGPGLSGSSAQQSTYHVYDAAGITNTVTNALGETTTTTYDSLARPTQIVVRNGDGSIASNTSYLYSVDHQSMTTTAGSGTNAISNTVYTDTFGNPVLQVHGDGTYQLTQYDANGNKTAFQDEQNNITTWTYDPLNEVVTETLPSSSGTAAVVTHTYDYTNRVFTTQMPGNVTSKTTEDAAGRTISEELDGTGGSVTRQTSYAYYSGASGGGAVHGLLQSVTDPRGFTNTITYDNFMRIATITGTGGSIPQQNQITSYTYDFRGLPLEITQSYASGTAAGPGTIIDRSYDGYGQISQETVSLVQSGTTVVSQWGQSWDAAGRRSALQWQSAPGGYGNAYTYSHLATGLMNAVSVPTVSGTSTFSATFADNELLTGKTIPGWTETVSQRDNRGRIVSDTVSVGGSPALTGSMTWRNDSRLNSYAMVRNGTGAWNETRNYDYDARGRLLTEPWNSSGTSTSTNSYQFDNPAFNGNTESGIGIRTLAQSDSSDYVKTTPSGTFAQITWDQLSTTGTSATTLPSYDAWGNITNRAIVTASGTLNQTLTWDSFNRLVSVSQTDTSGANSYTWTAVYDALGRRLETTFTPGGGSTLTLDSFYDPEVEFLELGVAVNGTRTWKVYGPDLNGGYGSLQGIGGLQATVDESNGTVTPLISDGFGNVVATVPSGTVTWGNTEIGGYGVLSGSAVSLNTITPLSQAVQWRGKYIDPTGFYYLGARYYEPQSGRFLSPDPLGHASSMSLYDYANGDPVNGIDPDGRFGKSSSFADSLNSQANGLLYNGPDYSQMPNIGKEIASEQAAENQVFSLPGLNVLRAGYQLATNTDLVTGDYISSSRDTLVEFGMANLETAVAAVSSVPFEAAALSIQGESALLSTSVLTRTTSPKAFVPKTEEEVEIPAAQEQAEPAEEWHSLEEQQQQQRVAQEPPATLNPKEIHFMQSSIKNQTGNYTVLENANALKNQTLKPADLPPIRVWRDNTGKIWTLDHRRLGAFRLSGIDEVPVQWADSATLQQQKWKMTTKTGGKSIKLKLGNGSSTTIE